MVRAPRASAVAHHSNLRRRLPSAVSRLACWYRADRSSVSSKSRMSLVAVSLPGRRTGDAAAARREARLLYPADSRIWASRPWIASAVRASRPRGRRAETSFPARACASRLSISVFRRSWG